MTTDQKTEQDAIEQVLSDHFVMWVDFPPPPSMTTPTPRGEWRCQCGLKFAFSTTAIRHQAKEIRRA